jgi:hypothetical protein
MSKNIISTGEINKMNLHFSTENCTLYSSTQVRGYKIQAADNLLVLPCSIINANVNVILSVINKRRKGGMMAVTRTSPSEPEYQEDIKLDTAKFNELNNKFGPFKIELFASKTNNLLPTHYTKDEDAYSTEWVRSSFYGNPKYTNDDIYRALDKAVSDFQKAPETTKFMFILAKMGNCQLVKRFHPLF